MQDAEGSTVLRLSGDARVEIPYQPFFKDLQQANIKRILVTFLVLKLDTLICLKASHSQNIENVFVTFWVLKLDI
jgi:hypothetical protein